MMRWLLFLTLLLLTQWFLPWYFLAIIGFIYGWSSYKRKKMSAWKLSVMAGSAGFLIWSGFALLKNYNSEYLITARLTQITQLNEWAIYGITGFIALVVTGLAAFSGAQIRRMSL